MPHVPLLSRSRVHLAAVVFAALLPYWITLGYGFHNTDDGYYILLQPFWARPGLNELWELVRRPVLANYQPLHLASYWLDRVVWGQSAFGLRVTQLALYAGGVVALWQLCRRLGLSPAARLLACLFYAWHPTHVENVAWISQRKDLLFTLLGLLALSAYLGPDPAPLDRPAPTAPARGKALALAWFALALAAKTQAIVFLPAFVVFTGLRRRFGQDWPWLAGLIGLAAVAGAVGYQAQALYGAAIEGRGWPQQGLLAGRAYLRFAAQAVLPAWCHPLPLPPSGSLTLAEGLGALAITTGSWSVLAGLRRRDPVPLALALWFLGALFPVSGVVPLAAFANDRYLMVPTIPLALWLARGLVHHVRHDVLRRRLALRMAAVGLVALCWTSQRYARSWRDDHTLWSYALARTPASTVLEVRLAAAMDEAGDPRAETLYLGILQRAPNSVPANSWLAQRALERGQRARARRHLVAASRSAENTAYTAILRLAYLEIEEENWAEAAEWLAAAEPRSPPNRSELSYVRAQLAEAQGAFEAAAHHYRQATTVLAEWQLPWVGLARCQRQLGHPGAARTAASNRGSEGQAVLAHLALDAGRLEEAAGHLATSAVSAELELARARLELARGQPNEAQQHLELLQQVEPRIWRRLVEREADLRELLSASFRPR